MQREACAGTVPLQELADLRQQAQIWCDSHHSEGDKLKAEVELLNGQLLQRSNELSSTREQLTEARAERDRALQERQQVGARSSGRSVRVWQAAGAAAAVGRARLLGASRCYLSSTVGLVFDKCLLPLLPLCKLGFP